MKISFIRREIMSWFIRGRQVAGGFTLTFQHRGTPPAHESRPKVAAVTENGRWRENGGAFTGIDCSSLSLGRCFSAHQLHLLAHNATLCSGDMICSANHIGWMSLLTLSLPSLVKSASAPRQQWPISLICIGHFDMKFACWTTNKNWHLPLLLWIRWWPVSPFGKFEPIFNESFVSDAFDCH